ncbi:UPF0481 protein At3g47200-like [Cornus florida]|uniref:UPF0481 protein At3g47200-like n=1 Tax=Cornus florida TaxID=4283 RepID=UPI0028A117D5|nr:UPF0481 protein At3g47200-like [Cornus florida]
MAKEENAELEWILEFIQRDIHENRSCNTQSLMADELSAPRVYGMYEVPDVLLEQNRDAYTPSCVSIGPLSRLWREDLNEMVAVKKRYMCELLERNGTFGATLRECTEAMLKLKSLVEDCYSKSYEDFYYNHLKYNQVRRDLVLLENQIPFFVLEELFRLTVERIPPDSTTMGPHPVSLRKCVLSLFGDMMGVGNIGGEIENLKNNSPYHILHFLHISHQSPLEKAPIFYTHMEKPRFKYNATKLRSVGVKFVTRNRVSLFDLKFTIPRRFFCLWKTGHFRIPRFSINEITETFLQNIIAFEYTCPGVDRYFTSHALAMSILMASAEDVKLLEEAGVICNHLDSGEAVLEIFKNITSNESIVRNQNLLYKDMWRQVMGFCSPWRLAFANVTTQMAVAAAIILNIITLLSSVYTVLSYYHNK